MINAKHFKDFFIKNLKQTEQCLLRNESIEGLELQLKKLEAEIIQQYEQITKLPKYSKNAIFKVSNDNKNLGALIYNYKIFQLHNMPQDAAQGLQTLLTFIQEQKQKYSRQRINKNVDINDRIKEVENFMRPHIQLVGEAQAVKDLQRGLSLLNKNRRKSPIEAKNILKQDGICGHKTIACLCDACKNYSPSVIKKYLKKGVRNNIIFGTKNNPNIDTKALMNELCKNLERSA